MKDVEEISKILETGSSDEKIKILEGLSNTSDQNKIQKIIMRLNDDDIKVRGEAFSSLILNENKISKLLIKNLESNSKNIRGFVTLVLANRKDHDAILPIIKLTKDERSMVRSCALGALGYLNAKEASYAIQECLSDTNIEVKKSALQATINLGNKVSQEKINEISIDADEELEKLLIQIKK